jgi:hypothetical protein
VVAGIDRSNVLTRVSVVDDRNASPARVGVHCFAASGFFSRAAFFEGRFPGAPSGRTKRTITIVGTPSASASAFQAGSVSKSGACSSICRRFAGHKMRTV